MKLESFGISSFKAFGASLQRMPLKPITLIFGPNSSGKSSLIHGLLWASEVALQRQFEIRSSGRVSGKLDLGGLHSLIRDHDTGKKITVAQQAESWPDGSSVEIRFGIGVRQREDDKEFYVRKLMEDPEIAAFNEARDIHRECAALLDDMFVMRFQFGSETFDLSTIKADLVSPETWELRIKQEREARRNAEWPENRCSEPFPSWEQAVEAIEKGQGAWDTCRKFAGKAIPKMRDLHAEFERRRLIDGPECSVIACEVRVRGEIAMKAFRHLTSDVMTIDSESVAHGVWEQISGTEAPPDLASQPKRPGGRTLGSLTFEPDASASGKGDLEGLLRRVVIPWLYQHQELFLDLAERLIVIGPLRALPARRNLLEFPGESPPDPLLTPWKRLRDDDAIRAAVNASLRTLTKGDLHFQRLSFGRIGRVARIEQELSFPAERVRRDITGR